MTNLYIVEAQVYKKRRDRREWEKIKNANKHLSHSGFRGTYRHFNKNRTNTLLSTPLRVFNTRGFIEYIYIRRTIIVPKFFSFKQDLDGSIVFFKELLSSFFLGDGMLCLDFSKCDAACIATFVQLDILLKELHAFKEKYNQGLIRRHVKWIKIIPSKREKILKYLKAFEIYSNDELNNLPDDDAYLPLKLHTGRLRKAYNENPKGFVGKKIEQFVNEAMKVNDVELNASGRNLIRSLIDEVLSNAEDHSIKNSEWYVNGVAFREVQHDTHIVELNLAIINYGDSMYEGFENTKEKNTSNYQTVLNAFSIHQPLLSDRCPFGKEGLFTMYMLNEGISRLKFEKASRGNGTINFLEAFILFGLFGKENSKFNSELNIITGHTVLTCDNTVKPYDQNTVKVVSLNKKQDQKLLPDKEYLHDYYEYFPGTILECRIYLNSDFFKKIIHK